MQVYQLDLQQLPLFYGLKPEEIESFIHTAGVQVRRYEKSARILQAYQKNNQIGVFVEGQGQMISEDRFGNESVGHTLKRGDMFGATSSVLTDRGNTYSIEALTDVLVLWIPYRAFLTSGPRLGRVHGVIMQHFLEAMSIKLILLMQKIELLSQKTLRERLILYLLQQEKQQQKEDVQIPGRVRMAQELECNRSALTREIRSMEQDGIIVCGSDWIRLNKDKI